MPVETPPASTNCGSQLVHPCCQERQTSVIQRPAELNAFEFAVLAGLRAAQLARGCTPRVNCTSKLAVIAQMEVAERKVAREPVVAAAALQTT
jgi:DNA-directed RNA polymerase subunit K/omega